MDDNRIQANLLEQDNTAGKATLEGIINHGVATILNNDGLAAEALNIGQGLNEDLCNSSGLLLFHVLTFYWLVATGVAKATLAAITVCKFVYDLKVCLNHRQKYQLCNTFSD